MSNFSGLRTYRGSCHCGAVRFEAELDLGAGTTRCNCTYCSKSGWWGCHTKPAAFRLLSGQESLVRLGKTPAADRDRCKTCGLEPFGHGDIPELGGEYYSVNIRCLDGVDLSGVPVHYLDGLHDTWGLIAEGSYVNPFGKAGGLA
ncbi:GFA family protein [Archangium lipolyticum]|uniref:GFA family protein n=1 Tax=Archangium lipolyticum TaxID=2970465 RepID=UPI00214A2D55|nr:GFA family protein [Archangium lipolyticum]